MQIFRRRLQIVAKNPPEIVNHNFVYSNALTNADEKIQGSQLPIGFDTMWEPGALYRDVIGREYLCESIEQDGIHMLLLNSVQHGRQVYSRIIMFPESSKHYVKISTASDVKRLRREYERFNEGLKSGRIKRAAGIAIPERGSIVTHALPSPSGSKNA